MEHFYRAPDNVVNYNIAVSATFANEPIPYFWVVRRDLSLQILRLQLGRFSIKKADIAVRMIGTILVAIVSPNSIDVALCLWGNYDV